MAFRKPNMTVLPVDSVCNSEKGSASPMFHLKMDIDPRPETWYCVLCRPAYTTH